MYRLHEDGVIRLLDNALIPKVSDNRDYVDYLVWLAEGNTPQPMAVPTFKDHVVLTKLKNNHYYNTAIEAITWSYPKHEKDTWDTQAHEVRVWQANPNTDQTPWFDYAALIRGIDRVDLLKRAEVKIKDYKMVSAYLTGKRQGYEDQIEAATTVAELDALVFDYTLPESAV